MSRVTLKWENEKMKTYIYKLDKEEASEEKVNLLVLQAEEKEGKKNGSVFVGDDKTDFMDNKITVAIKFHD